MTAPGPQVSPSPEIVPALDENRPEIGPNMADDEQLCRDVAQFIYTNHAYPYLLMQQRLWPIWMLIDDAWRVKCQVGTLNITQSDPSLFNKNADGKGKDGGMTSTVDGYSAKVQAAAIFKQIKTKTDMHMSIAYADGLPVRAVKPETTYEHPLYDPTQQSVDAANELLRQNAKAIDLEVVDRKGRGCWAKYGFVNVAIDWKYELEDIPMGFELPQDPRQAEVLIQAEMQRFNGQQPQIKIRQMMDGTQRPFAVWMQRVVKTMKTEFVPLRHDDVFMDLTLSGGIQKQPCPVVREHCTRYDLLGNDYDPVKNPFGWLNVQKAYREDQNQWTLSAQDEQQLRQELLKKWNQQSQSLIPQMQAIKQRWRAYPYLAIVPTPDGKKLDTGEGIECWDCKGIGHMQAPTSVHPMTGDPQGVGSVPCPTCQGEGKVYGNPERYVVEFFGLLMTSPNGGNNGCTVLRIQKLPDPKGMLPLIFGAHLIEDDAGAIPMSLVEASISAWIQLATAHNQFLDFKNRAINPPTLIPEGSPLKGKDINRVNGTIEYENNPDSIRQLTLPVDATQNLIEYSQGCEAEIRDIIGMSDQLLGVVQSGRRSASEINNAFDAAKMPITVEIDSYNRQVLQPHAQAHLDNIEQWADRDWIQRKTGRTTFGKVELFSAVADEFMKKMGLIQNTRYVLEASVGDPSINRAELWMQLMTLTGLPDPGRIVNDGGLRKAQMDGLKIVAQILGDGIPVPPDMSDPDDIYIPIFQEALKDDYWRKKTPENMPLLEQRLQIQQIQVVMKQNQALLQAAHQQAVLNPPDQKGANGNGNKPKTPNQTPQNKAQATQQMAGAQQG